MARLGKISVQYSRLLLLLVGVMLIGLFYAGCATQQKAVIDDSSKLSSAQLEQAQRLYAQLIRENSLHRDRKSLELAGNLLDYYKGFNRNDEVLTLASQSARRLGDLPMARKFLDELLDDYSYSALFDQTLMNATELAADSADTLAAAGYMIRYHDRDPARATQSNGKSIATIYIDSLDADSLGLLMDRHQDSALWPYIGYLRVRELLLNGSNNLAELVASRLEIAAADDSWTLAARELISGPPLTRDPDFNLAVLRPNQVGVLCPLSGRYAVLGNAFYDAALMALSDANATSGSMFELKVEDTAGDPVDSAIAARRLCQEEGSMALLGSLMSDPTVAAAIVADIYNVPLVSPTATNDHIWELGDNIFQTNLTGLFEARLLAQMAVDLLLKQRIAVIFPDNDEGRRHADVFTHEVELLGGEIVASVAFAPQGTSFKDAILELVKERPEVIFAPATVDQMILLGPQLDFFHAGALVMGLSNWNSEKLLARAGTVMERAVFPSDLALFPVQWTAEFNARWDGSNYPREATTLALKSYQATRMLLDTMVESEATNRGQLSAALRRRLASRDVEAEGPEPYAISLRMFSKNEISTFPSDVFTEAWNLTEGAAADSLAILESELDQMLFDDDGFESTDEN